MCVYIVSYDLIFFIILLSDAHRTIYINIIMYLCVYICIRIQCVVYPGCPATNRKNKIITRFRYAFYIYLLYIYAYENTQSFAKSYKIVYPLVAWAMYKRIMCYNTHAVITDIRTYYISNLTHRVYIYLIYTWTLGTVRPYICII